MMANEVINALKCHVMRHGDCEVEVFIQSKKGLKAAATLYVVEHEDTDKHPRVILKGKIGY